MPVDRDAQDPTGLYDGYPDAEHYTAPDDDKELVTKLKKFFDDSFESKRSYVQTWETNRAYLQGEVVARNIHTGDLVKLAYEDGKKLRSRNNMLRPVARSLVGKLSKMIPTCTVLPATSDFAEQHAAKVGDALFQFFRRKEDLDNKYLRVMNFQPWAGNAFMELLWDPQGGKKIACCSTEDCGFYDYNLDLVGSPCPRCDGQRKEEAATQQMAHQAGMAEAAVAATSQLQPNQPIVQPEELSDLPLPPMEQQGPLPLGQEAPPLVEAYEGDACFKIQDPRDVFLPPGCEQVAEASRICIRNAVEVAEARAMFPDFAMFIHREEGLFTDKTGRWRYNQLDTQGTMNYLSDHVYVYKFLERPTEQYPEGRTIFMVNDIIVEETASDFYCLTRLPVYHFGFDSNDGEVWREPFITQAIHRQRELDNLETKIREHIELLLAQKWLIPTGSRITAEEITAHTGQVIEYNAAAGNPKPIDVPQLPQAAWQRKQDLVQDMRMQASVTDQEQGLTTSDPNGRAMAIVNAEADQQVGPIVTRNNGEWREMHRDLLILVQEKYHHQRVITVAGPEGVQTYSFEEANLSPGWDVQIEEQDGLSRNPAIRFNEALQLAQVGQGALFIDKRTGTFDSKAFARTAKLKMPDSGHDSESTERAAAQAIPYLVMKGMTYQPQEFDDPALFDEELLAWLRGPGRQADPSLLDQIKQIWMYYRQWVVSQQMPQPGMGQDASQPGAGGQSAPGGTPNNAGGLGTNLAPGLVQQANKQVQQADNTGEKLANAGAHEH